MVSLLHIEVVEARDLLARDRSGFSDPYCLFVLAGQKHPRTTKVKNQTLNPIWHEEFKIPIMDAEDVRYGEGGLTFEIHLYDHDRFAFDDFLGKVCFTITKELPTKKGQPKWYTLVPDEYIAKGLEVKGEVRIDMHVEWANMMSLPSMIGRAQHKITSKMEELARISAEKLSHYALQAHYWTNKHYDSLVGHMVKHQPPTFSFTKKLLAGFKHRTRFTTEELELLFYSFRNFAHPNQELDHGSLVKAYPIIKTEQVIAGAMFVMMNQRTEDQICFDEYVHNLSMAVRGSLDERVQAVCQFFDPHRTRFIQRIMFEVQMDALCRLFKPIVNKQTVLRELFGELEGVTLISFYNRLRKYEEKQLLADALHLSDGPTYCFGLFAYLYKMSLVTIEQMISLNDAEMKPEKEGYLYKKAGNLWTQYWFCLRNGFLFYYHNPKHEPHKVLLIENHCLMNSASVVTRVPSVHIEDLIGQVQPDDHHLEAKNEQEFKLKIGSYEMLLRASSVKKAHSWKERIISHSVPFSQPPFGSFAPVRHGVKADWFVDGKDTYEAMKEAILNAREEIFITDWFLSPEVFLVRQGSKLTFRLDELLRQKAAEGVKIYIIVWNETKLALNLNSARVKSVLESIHKNVQVIAHPTLLMKWSHHQKTVVIDQDIAFVGGLDMCFGRWDTPRHTLIDTAGNMFPGKDYYNPAQGADIDGLDYPFLDLIDRQTIPRMPWHDVSVRLEGYVARDVSKNFIQRWNHHRDEIQMSSPLLVPKSHVCPNLGTCDSQIVRSMSVWSGLDEIHSIHKNECSVHTAMVHHIRNAKHFVYIENQYFISSTAGRGVKNEIAQCILDRLRVAIQTKIEQKLEEPDFRCIVVLPVHPEGTYKDSASIRYIMKWQYDTINRGKNSILKKLQEEFPNEDLSSYISFNALRNYGLLNGHLVTEQIYVHTKMTLIDDRVAIIGSANINDRSLLGDRDSEIAVVIEDMNLQTSRMNGQVYMAGNFAFGLRMALWKEHLGFTSNDPANVIMDPISAEAYGIWKATANGNTKIFTEVFGTLEGDSVENIRDLGCRNRPTATQELQTTVSCIKGHLIEYPLDFLKNDLDKSVSSFDIMVAGDDVFV